MGLDKPFLEFLQKTEETKTRFFIFFVLAQYYYLHGLHSQMKTLYDDTKDQLQSESNMLQYTQAMLFLSSHNQQDVLKGLYQLDQLLENNDNVNPEILYTYSSGVVDALEGNLLPRRLEKELLARATRRIDDALVKKEHAEYYFTRARLLMQIKDFEQATADLRNAKSCEDPLSQSFSERMIEYGMKSLQLDQMQAIDHMSSLKNELESIRGDFKEDQWRVVEFVGIFSALIALFLGSISLSVSSGLSFQEILRLILAMGGIWILIIETLIIRFTKPHSNKKYLETGIFIILATFLILVAWL